MWLSLLIVGVSAFVFLWSDIKIHRKESISAFIVSIVSTAFIVFVTALFLNINIFVVGGGGLSRNMEQKVLETIHNVDSIHEISMSITQTNAVIFSSYLEDKNPKEFFDAKPIKDMTWKEYFKMFSISPDDENTPNAHIPVDAKCSIFCDKKNIAFHVTGGKLLYEIESIAKILQKGTFIHS